MQILIVKSQRLLTLTHEGAVRLRARVALGAAPIGPKRREGDGRTPEGVYHICLCKENGKYGLSLGLDYPNADDARRAYGEGVIDADTLAAIRAAAREKRRPPWGTALGGEIYLHEGGAATDWTQGCVALESADMAVLFPLRTQIEAVEIRP